MSIKMFCDACGKETPVDYLSKTKTGQKDFRSLSGAWVEFRVKAEILFTLIPVGTARPVRHLCENCGWKVIDTLDPRPREVLR